MSWDYEEFRKKKMREIAEKIRLSAMEIFAGDRWPYGKDQKRVDELKKRVDTFWDSTVCFSVPLEVHYATRIRENTGQTPEGGHVQEGGSDEGSEDLERQASE